jgi:hypothetical protein
MSTPERITLADVRALFPKCIRCGQPCLDEQAAVVVVERPYRVAHLRCEQRLFPDLYPIPA